MINNHRKLIIPLFIFVIFMFGFGFALVPIYNSLCKALNINGKTNNTPIALPTSKNQSIHSDRTVLVQFIATNNSDIPWAFFPKTQQIQIHPGQIARLAFYAENQTDRTMTVQAIPSVTPGLAAKYLKKTECFCFTQQTLNGHEAMDMPLIFHLDAELPEEIKTITLAYTLFDVTSRLQRFKEYRG